MSKALTSAPAVEPLSLSEVKAHLRVDNQDEDALIEELITAARQYLESVSGVYLITQTWRQYEDRWPLSGCLNHTVRPVQSVQSLTVYDEGGLPQTILAEDYQLDIVSLPARLYLPIAMPPGKAMNGIEVDIIAGYGDTGVAVPDALKRAILMLIAHWFEFRGAILPSDQPVSIPPGFEALIAPYKRRTL